MLNRQIHLTLPVWTQDWLDEDALYLDDEAKMQLAIDLAMCNVQHQSGGPFGAALFDGEGRVLGIGVNRVMPQHCSAAHAEMMAFMTAQQRLQSFRLNAVHGGVTLATSAQPCAMCYGASIWAGIDTLLIGASKEDVESLSEFDEGPLPEDWIGELRKRGIEVRKDILREPARQVFHAYAAAAGASY